MSPCRILLYTFGTRRFRFNCIVHNEFHLQELAIGAVLLLSVGRANHDRHQAGQQRELPRHDAVQGYNWKRTEYQFEDTNSGLGCKCPGFAGKGTRRSISHRLL